MQQLHHKRNEKKEVEFFQNEEYTIPFDFTNAKDLYIELKDGDVTPIFALDNLLQYYKDVHNEYYNIRLYTNYTATNISNIAFKRLHKFQTLDDITPNLSKYIPEDNILMFIGSIEELCKFNKIETKYTTHHAWFCNEENKWIIPEPKQSKKLTIFLPHGTKSELQKAEEVGEYLWENFGIKPNLCALHFFVEKKHIIKTLRPSRADRMYNNEIYGYEMQKICKNINKIITTNSTGILPVQDNERLQVIDCKEMFEGAVKK